MTKTKLRAGIYHPPEDMLPFVAVVITPQGQQYIETFWNEDQATEFVAKHQRNFLEKFSVVGRGIRGDSPDKD